MHEKRLNRFIVRLVDNADDLAQRAGDDVAVRFYRAVESTCALILANPKVGLLCRYADLRLADLRFHPVLPPFRNWLVFYRIDDDVVIFWSVEHGAQDLPFRLAE